MAVVLNTQITLNPNNQIAHIADWTGLVVGTGYIVSGSFLQPDTRFTFQGFGDIALSRQPLSVPQAQTEVPAVISTLPQPAAAGPPAGYPYNVNDRLVSWRLNDAFEYNASPYPPAGNGGGAGMYNDWIDTGAWPWPNPPGGTVEILRKCIVPQATPGSFVDAEWITLGYIHRDQRRFWFNGNNVGFVNGLTIGSGGLTITDPNAQMPFVRLTGDVMTGNLITPGLTVQRSAPGAGTTLNIINAAGGTNSIAQLAIVADAAASRTLSFHINASVPEIALVMGMGINTFSVHRTNPDVRQVGGFNNAGWSLGYDGRLTAGNDTDYGMLASGDSFAAILCGRYGLHNYYRTTNQHRFENRDGGQLWGYIDGSGINTDLRVNAAWFDLRGIKFAERGYGSQYTTMHDSSGTMIGHTNSNVGHTTHFNWIHIFANRNNTGIYAQIDAGGISSNGRIETQYFHANRNYGAVSGYRFDDRVTTFTFDTFSVVPYFEWYARDNKVHLYWSIDGTVRFQFDYSGQFTLNGINLYNNAGNLQIANAGLNVAGVLKVNTEIRSDGAIWAHGVLDFGLVRDGADHRYFRFDDGVDYVYNPGDLSIVQTTQGVPVWVLRWSDGMSYSARGPAGGLGAYVNNSDRRAKTDIVPATAGLPEILQLQPVEFQRLSLEGMPASQQELGFIAQDVAPVIPHAVRIMGVELPDGTGGLDDPEPTLGVTSEAIIAVMVNAFKTIDDRLKLLEGA